MAEEAALSSHTTVRSARMTAWHISKSLHHLRRTHSFAIRPGKAKKPGDSNETLQERKEKTTGEKTKEKKKQEIQGCEYLGAVKSADGTAPPLGSKAGVRVPTVQHE